MIEQYTSPVAVNNSQEPWLVGEGVVVSGGVAIPSLDFNFITGGLPGTVTFTRGSNATQFDSSGNLVYAPNNAIRNNTMVGAVAGTPGTMPTNWSTFTTLTGLTREVVGTGTESGITYIDIRLSGTPSAAGDYGIYEETSTGIAAATGQTWAQSVFLRTTAGSQAGISSITLRVDENTSGGVFVSNKTSSALTVTSTLTRFSAAYTLTGGATVARVMPWVRLVLSGAAIDITLRIGLPQLEIGPTATAVNLTSGTAYYGPRFDYNPTTLAARGLLIEEQRTNSIRNNTMQGAVAGTPGTLPNNWSVFTTLTGLTRTLAVGIENGISYIDIRLSGTPSAAGDYQWFDETTTGVAATSGQTWTHTAYYKLQAGSMTGVGDFQIVIQERDAAGNYLNGTFTNQTTPTGAIVRGGATRTLNQATTAFAFPGFRLTLTGAAIDITLRIGLPQLEQGAFATSVIPTTTTALTRSADVASVNTLSPWYNASEGTIYFEGSTTNTAEAPFLTLQNGGLTDFFRCSRAFNQSRLLVTVASGTAADLYSGNTTTLGAVLKTAGAYKVNDFANVLNAGTVAVDTSGAVPTVTTLQLGSGGFLGSLGGYIRRITYYPRRLSNAELQAITA